MSGRNDAHLKSDVDILFDEYEKTVKESRSAIQVIGLSVSLLSVFKDLEDLSVFQAYLVKLSLGLLFFSLLLAIVSFVLSEYYKPRDERFYLIGSVDREARERIAERVSERNAKNALNKVKILTIIAHGSYFLFSCGIAVLLIMLFKMY